MKTYFPTIGIECHVQLKTKTKLFDGVDNDARDAAPNTLIGPLCFGLPGTLPVLNSKAIDLAIRAGVALNAEVAGFSKFDRKHYFYPDLPKGYQITQYDEPIILNGRVDAVLSNGEIVTIRVERAHLEEDAGKSTHPTGADFSLVDLNRAGTPLLEIVSFPDIHTAIEAKAYARELYLLMRYAGVSEADLFYGNMRFDVNVSISDDPTKLGTRSETKNLNSFRSVEKAVEYEIKRQTEVLEKGEKVVQETRGWDDAKQKTFSQRSKEDAHDYRYFPDPDIPPIVISPEEIEAVKKDMPAMPGELRSEFAGIGLERSQVETLLDAPEAAEVMHFVVITHDHKTARTIGNWLTGEIQRLVTGAELSWTQVIDSIDKLVKLASMQDSSLLSSSAAKGILKEVIVDNSDPEKVAEKKNLLQVSDESELITIIEQVINDNQAAADDVRAGELKAIGFLVGQVMRHSAGKANPSVVSELIKKQLQQ
jgi:aspartyl-tRNA(Asn)/glutamyl-tRNA(Gln) amidotransferase subunit B